MEFGVDIYIQTDADNNIYTDEFYAAKLNIRYYLSRGFCRLIHDRHQINGEPELDQIARITSTDVSVFYKMEEFFKDPALLAELRRVGWEQAVSDAIKRKYDNNIDIVLETINALIEKLSAINDFSHLLTNPEAVEHAWYFSNFNTDTGVKYTGHNLGHDLRTFKRFLEYAKGKGATMTFFLYD
ncbi:MAG: hypothetical protein JO154_15270 [Chitinophaga sp.]|uniref:hypothetical protein n=1 Tax=Chitinophaga sp. TaxID=1869181 RepID=UPI0025BB6B78|nr:hypothetical protein [Chitinophaga sp.]MBV8253962.1 hypothetical protein [Chitinophaga sp.]